MASTNVGDQEITFKYQQEGTAKSFNKLLHEVIPTGIISGGEINPRVSGGTVDISPMEMMICDNEVTIHVKTKENASVVVTDSTPYVIATFDWSDVVNNYVTFKAVSFNTLTSTINAIVFGRCEMEGDNVTGVDYTRRTNASSSDDCNRDFQYKNGNVVLPSFTITSLENNNLGFNVSAGKAIVNGKTVKIDSEQSITLVTGTGHENDPLFFTGSITNGRTDIIILKDDGSVEYIMGRDVAEQYHLAPTVPNYALLLATVSFPSAEGVYTKIKGSWIKNVYNNNYIANSPTIGKERSGVIEHPHTLYI